MGRSLSTTVEATTSDATITTIWSGVGNTVSAFAQVAVDIPGTEAQSYLMHGILGDAGEGATVFNAEISRLGTNGSPTIVVAFSLVGGLIALRVTGIAATSISWTARVTWAVVD